MNQNKYNLYIWDENLYLIFYHTNQLVNELILMLLSDYKGNTAYEQNYDFTWSNAFHDALCKRNHDTPDVKSISLEWC